MNPEATNVADVLESTTLLEISLESGDSAYTALEEQEEDQFDALEAPLIPYEYSDLAEAFEQFSYVFGLRYGANNPFKHLSTLHEAYIEAFEKRPNSSKPLVLYIHDDNCEPAHNFAQNVICTDAVSRFLKENAVAWAWDITDAQNWHKFIGWLELMRLEKVIIAAKAIPCRRFPALIILGKKGNEVTPFSTANAVDDTVKDVMDKLMSFEVEPDTSYLEPAQPHASSSHVYSISKGPNVVVDAASSPISNLDETFISMEPDYSRLDEFPEDRASYYARPSRRRRIFHRVNDMIKTCYDHFQSLISGTPPGSSNILPPNINEPSVIH